jgi:hypothetical protein
MMGNCLFPSLNGYKGRGIFARKYKRHLCTSLHTVNAFCNHWGVQLPLPPLLFSTESQKTERIRKGRTRVFLKLGRKTCSRVLLSSLFCKARRDYSKGKQEAVLLEINQGFQCTVCRQEAA